MFRSYNHNQGAYCMCFVEVIIVKQSFKMRRYGINSAVWLHIYPVCNGVCTVLRVTLHGALYTHQQGLARYAATRPN